MKHKLRKRLAWHTRRITSPLRALPDFLIIGVMKAGTSSLFSYLSQHPNIVPSIKKEIHFFDGGNFTNQYNHEKGQLWYRSYFPLKIKKQFGYLTFEATPKYIYHLDAPERIFNLIPNAKLIAIFRNPTERAISHYFHMKRKKYESLSLMNAIELEYEKYIEPNDKNKPITQKDFRLAYIRRGFYAQQLNRYFKFFSRENILILDSEDLFNEPETVLKQTFRFLNLKEDVPIHNLKPLNVSKNKDKVDPAVYDFLDNLYKPHNEAFFKLVGKTYNW